jgi:hypothetical protein
MAKFRQKPIIIEAVQWNGQNSLEIRQFTGENVRIASNVLCVGRLDMHIGDWIIKESGFRVCDNAMFENAYKPTN